jgi:hypothetical protein
MSTLDGQSFSYFRRRVRRGSIATGPSVRIQP